PHREYLRNLYVEALTNLANISIQANHYEQAVHYLRKIFSLNPAHEEICIKLMDCLAHAGHRTEALRYAVDCEEALAELGVRPSTQLFVSKEKLVGII
ncbi:MAG: tetratricopeptide repeat protein, partial [Deltaproteobacteria bacterium]|nr:tetratricopeptide repeat protein [Deltaproteobacteria bacterium]